MQSLQGNSLYTFFLNNDYVPNGNLSCSSEKQCSFLCTFTFYCSPEHKQEFILSSYNL